jgi:hypothetical protein
MRLTATGRWRVIAISLCVAALAIAALIARGNRSDTAPPSATSFVAASPAAEGNAMPRFKPETRNDLGRFALGRGRQVKVSSAETTDGQECLIEDDGSGEASSCLEHGLFATRKAELVVGSMGGPEHFDELHVTGIVAPGIRSARLVKTDGTEADLELNADRAFVYDSSTIDLREQVYPTALRLFASDGRLVATVHFPAAG